MGLLLGIGNHISKNTRLGSKLNQILSFDVDEGITEVGTIDEPNATSFEITEGADDFTVSNDGLIEFIVAPDYETQNLYTLRVKSDKGKRYFITVNINDVASAFALNTDTELLFETTF